MSDRNEQGAEGTVVPINKLNPFERARALAQRARDITDYYTAMRPDSGMFPDTHGPLIKQDGPEKALTTAARELAAGVLKVTIFPENNGSAELQSPEV